MFAFSFFVENVDEPYLPCSNIVMLEISKWAKYGNKRSNIYELGGILEMA